MVFLRLFKILFVIPFHPKFGFGLYQDEPRQQLIRRLSYYITFVGMMSMFYFMVNNDPELFSDPPFLAWLAIVFIKFFGIMTFYFIFGIMGVIMGFDEIQRGPISTITLFYSLTIIPEFIFIISVYYYPIYYQEARFLCHVWRAILMSYGIYFILDMPWSKSIGVGATTTLILYLFNYNYFALIESEY